MSDETDQVDLARMLERLRALLDRLSSLPGDVGPVSVAFREADGRGHRIVAPTPASLRDGRDLAAVAFFGLRRCDADPAALHAADTELIDDLAAQPEIVSYSSLERGPRQGGNLVLATSAAALERWSRTRRHERVARQLAPLHYVWVRIHHGILEGGIPSSSALRLTQTRQIQFEAA